MNINKEELNTEKEICQTEFAYKTATYMYENEIAKMQNDTKTGVDGHKMEEVDIELQIQSNIKEETVLKPHPFEHVKNTNIIEGETMEEMKTEVEAKGVENDQIKNYEETEIENENSENVKSENENSENENSESENSYAFQNCISNEITREKEMQKSKHELTIEKIPHIECTPDEKIKTFSETKEASVFFFKCENDANVSLKDVEENKISEEGNTLEIDIEKTVIEDPHVFKKNDSESDIFRSYSDNLKFFNCSEDEKEIFNTEIREFDDDEIAEETDKENKNDTFLGNVNMCIDDDLTLDDAESLIMKERAEEVEETTDENINENKYSVATENNNEVEKKASDKQHVGIMENIKNDKIIEEEMENEIMETDIKTDVTHFVGLELKEMNKKNNTDINRIEKLEAKPICSLKKDLKRVYDIKENKKLLKKIPIISKVKAPLFNIQRKQKTIAESEKIENDVNRLIEKNGNNKEKDSINAKKFTNNEHMNCKNIEKIKKKEKTNEKQNKTNDENNELSNINQYNFFNIKKEKFDVFRNSYSTDRNENAEVKEINETKSEEEKEEDSSQISFIVKNENTESENESPFEIDSDDSESSKSNEDTYQDKKKNILSYAHNVKQNNIYKILNKPAENKKGFSYNYKMNKMAMYKNPKAFNKTTQGTDLNKKYEKFSFKNVKQVSNRSNLNNTKYGQYEKKNFEYEKCTNYFKWNTPNIPKHKKVRTVGTQKCLTKKMVNKGVNTSNFLCATNDKKIVLPNFIYTPSLKLRNYNFDAIRVENGRIVPKKMDIIKLVFQNS